MNDNQRRQLLLSTFPASPIEAAREAESLAARRIRKYHIGQMKVTEEAVIEAAIRDASPCVSEVTRRWFETAKVAIEEAIRLRGKIAELVDVEIAGSMGSGTFYAKGLRNFDIDLLISNPAVVQSSRPTRMHRLEPSLWNAIRALRRRTTEHLDLFVEWDEKVWSLTSRGCLSRNPGLFGKTPRMMSSGIIVRGQAMPWQQFERSLRDSVLRSSRKSSSDELAAK